MTSIYRKAVNELFDQGQEELSSIDRACILGLILGSMTNAEKVSVAARIEMLEARLTAHEANVGIIAVSPDD